MARLSRPLLLPHCSTPRPSRPHYARHVRDMTMITSTLEAQACTRCRQLPRVVCQRWCRVCRAAWKRERRRKNTSSPVPQVPSTPVATTGNTAQLALPNTRTEASEALAAYRTALDDFERARSLDWKRQRHPPATTLVPLWERVETAKRHCLVHGVNPDGEQSLVTRGRKL